MTEERKNILLVGLEGKGKTTLANVLSGKENALKEKDKYNKKNDSSVDSIQTIEFEIENEKYRVIDTVGINSEELKLQQILRMIGKGYKKFGKGLIQILFVVQESITKDEVELFDILRKILFDEKVTNHISIV